MDTPILESMRLTLRPLTLEDAAPIFNKWTSDPEVARYMSWDRHETIEDTVDWLRGVEAGRSGAFNYDWGFVLRETGELFGAGCLEFHPQHRCFELGYALMKDYWGQGLATEAAERILDFGRHELGETRFFAGHAAENLRSQKVLQKLGFQYQSSFLYTSLTGKKTFIYKIYIFE